MRHKELNLSSIWVMIILMYSSIMYSQQNNFYNLNLQLKIPEKFYEVFFVDSLTGWIGGGHGLLLKTTNGGIDWVQEDLGITSDIKKIQFNDRANGWLYAKDTCLKTTDGGETWFEFSKTFKSTMYFYNNNYGWALNSRSLYRTVDGGKTWTYKLTFWDTVEDMHFFDPYNGYALGGIIGQSSDGGETWYYVSPGFGITSAFYFNKDEVWAVGHSGNIYKINKFDEREYPRSGTSQLLNDIHFFNHSNGYIVGNRGTILKLQDSINYWDTIPRLTYNNLFSVFLNDSNNVWIGGDEIILTNHTGIFVNNDIKDTVIEYDSMLTIDLWAKGIPAPVFHLLEYPEGMTIDTITGKIEWRASSLGYNKVIVEAVNLFDVRIDSFSILVEPLTDFKAELSEISGKINLTNYPNPFNPVTTILYSVPKEAYVSLKIHDSNGEEIAELVNEFKTPGSYNVTFNAANLSSGIYFCTLRVGELSQTHKLMLFK